MQPSISRKWECFHCFGLSGFAIEFRGSPWGMHTTGIVKQKARSGIVELGGCGGQLIHDGAVQLQGHLGDAVGQLLNKRK